MKNTPADPSPAPERITLLSADDALAARIGATGLLGNFHRVHTVAQLEAQLPTLKPDCLLLAVSSEDRSVADLIESLQTRLPRCRLIVLSPDDDSDHVVACLRAGADDFLSLRDPLRLPDRLARILGNVPAARVRRPIDRGFKTLADSAPALVWITDSTGEFIHFNRPWLAFTGRKSETELGQGWLDDIFPEDRPRFRAEFAAHFKRREPFRIDFRLRRHDGLYRWITCQGIPHYEEDEFFTGCIGSCMDITDQHEAETLLAYRAITQAALAGFGRYALGPHKIEEIKQEATRLVCDILQLNYSEVLIFTAPASDALRVACSTGFRPGFLHAPMTAREARAEGDKCLRLDEDKALFPGRENHAACHVRGGIAASIYIGDFTLGFLTGLSVEPRAFGREAIDFIEALATTISTVHQRNQAELTLQESESKLLQSQKMEAIGQLAGGVAHDFNNLLTAVRCYGDMLHHDLTDIAPHLKSKTGEILRAADRASALTRQLLAFSRKQVLQPEPLDMNRVIANLHDLVRSLLSESVSLHIRFAEDSVCFLADGNQFDQVVLNLCLNARDAMPQGGLLTIAVDLASFDDTNPHQLPPGDYIQLTVGDTGTGISPEVQARLFQPFFTTKPVGRGTGLGLATCAVIIKNCNGVITFESVPGKGTRFILFLPKIEPPRVDFFLEQEEQINTGRERILIVEDDEAVRQITFAVLDSFGYRVTAVPAGTEALALFKLDPPPVFDLLLSDVIMPDMDGLTLAGRFQALHPPGLRTLFMSGYLGSAETVKAVTEYNLPFLEKPFTLDDLARKVREALDSPPSALPPSS
jgi:PAS domain S-box-containing protein